MNNQNQEDSYKLLAIKTILNPGEDDELQCTGYKRDIFKSVLAHFISICLLGFPYLVGYWKPEWQIKWFRSKSPLFIADTVLIQESNKNDDADQSPPSVAKIVVENVAESFMPRYVHQSSEMGSNDSMSSSASSESSDRERLWVPSKLTLRYFIHHHCKYVWDAKKKAYCRLHGLDKNTPLHLFSSQFSHGLTSEMQKMRQLLYGPNNIDVEVKPYIRLLFEEVLNAFYIFQIASIILWSLDEYYYYASCIALISAVSVIVSLIETRRQSQSLHDMVTNSNEMTAKVYRGKDIFETIESTQLVPGDLIVIPSDGCIMSCDAVLLAGTCIVNESMLTGESVPVMKSSLPLSDLADGDDGDEDTYDPERHKRHTLFSGTSVIQTRYYGQSHVLAVVVRTGFDTAKGSLVRSILYPKPIGFKFDKHSKWFIMVLFSIAAVGMGYCLYVYVKRHAPLSMVILRCLDIITIVVPPALPAAMTVGTYYAQNRLKKLKIFCISPQRINVCGKLKLVCFDKTGTLTEDGLDLYGVQATSMSWKNKDLAQHNDFEDHISSNLRDLQHESPLMTCLAACQSLTLINGELTGDPLDVKMFEATGWSLEEEGTDNAKFDMLMPSVVKPPKSSNDLLLELDEGQYPYEVGIIRQFTFSSSAARMSVITRALNDNHFHVFTKGAPEKLEELCLPHTLPPDFHQRLKQLTLRGFRVIGLAHKQLPAGINWLKVQKMKRDQAEKELNFLGFLIMQNTLKPQTTPVIKELLKADIRTVMVTGDNLLTAISVARDCNMVGVHDKVFIVEATFDEDNEQQPASIKFLKTEDDNNIDMYANDTIDMELACNKEQYHFAMSGKSWAVLRVHFPHLVSKIIQRGTIFARMSPDQKAQLVEEYQAIDYIVSMCGDGANDCGALKAAHVGISLSEAEASVAAPFTSQIADITCVPAVIKEGRCALVTSFGVFRYMALYSMVQFISVLILYSLQTNLGDFQFFYIDLFITAVVAVFMGQTKPFEKLVAKRPSGSLVSGPNLVSLFLQIFLSMGIQTGVYFLLTTMPWYEPVHPKGPSDEIVLCWETTSIFCVSSFQYLILAVIFSKGRPYRQPFYTNVLFTLSVFILAAVTILVTIYPGTSLAKVLQLMFDPDHPMKHIKYRLILLAWVAVNIFLCVFIEKAIVERRWLKKVIHFVIRKKKPRNRFRAIQSEMNNEGWPYVSPMYRFNST